MPGKKKKYNARFPPARIKKIMQTDEEVGKVAAPVPVIISRALELFAEALLTRANDVTSKRGARTLTPSHLKLCIETERKFDFLRELVSSVPDLQDEEGEGEGEILLPLQPSRGKRRIVVGIDPANARTAPEDHDVPGRVRGGSVPRGGVGSRGGGHSRGGGTETNPQRGTGRRRGRPPKVNGVLGVPGRGRHAAQKRGYPEPADQTEYHTVTDSSDEDGVSNTRFPGPPPLRRIVPSSPHNQVHTQPVDLSRTQAVKPSYLSSTYGLPSSGAAPSHPGDSPSHLGAAPSHCRDDVFLPRHTYSVTSSATQGAAIGRSLSVPGISSSRFSEPNPSLSPGSAGRTPVSVIKTLLVTSGLKLETPTQQTGRLYPSSIERSTSHSAIQVQAGGKEKLGGNGLNGSGGSRLNGSGSDTHSTSPTQPRDHRTVLYQESNSVFHNSEPQTEPSDGGKSNYIKAATASTGGLLSFTAAGGPAVSLPQIESGTHSFIRSLNTACLQGPAQRGSTAAIGRPAAVRRDVIDEDYD